MRSPAAAASAGICPHCGAGSVSRVRGLQGISEVAIAIALLLAFVLPGLIYYIWIESIPVCASCGRRVFRRAA